MPMRETPKLSTREGQLLELAAGGLTDTAIAHKLGVSETTVKTYWGRIRTKIGHYSRTELVAKVLRRSSLQAVAALREENRRLTHRFTQEAKGAAANIFKELIEQAADAILILSSDGVIRLTNESATQLFGWTASELKGQHVSMLLPERFRVIHGTHIEDYLAHPAKKTMGEHMATPALHRSGTEFNISASLSATTHGSETVLLCVVRQVEEEHIPEELIIEEWKARLEVGPDRCRPLG